MEKKPYWVGLFSSVLLLAGCMVGSADELPSETPGETETLDQAQVIQSYACFRNPPPLPGGGNIEGFIIDCINAGGEGACFSGQPYCCRTNHGVRECTDDPSQWVRSFDPDTSIEPDVAPIVEPTPGQWFSVK